MVIKKSAEIRIDEIVLDLVSTHPNGDSILRTAISITDDSDIGQSLNLVMLFELECDLLNPSARLSIISLSVCWNNYALDEKAEVIWGGKIERLLRSCL